jgi:hypothetical protein
MVNEGNKCPLNNDSQIKEINSLIQIPLYSLTVLEYKEHLRMLALSSTEFNFWSAWYCQLGITWLCIDRMSGDIHVLLVLYLHIMNLTILGIRDGKFSLVYLSPEMLLDSDWNQILLKSDIYQQKFNFWSAWYCQLGITWLCIDRMSGDIHRLSNSVF